MPIKGIRPSVNYMLKVKTETLKHCVKYVQKQRHQNNANGVVLVSLLLTYFRTYFRLYSSICIVNFEQVNAGLKAAFGKGLSRNFVSSTKRF